MWHIFHRWSLGPVRQEITWVTCEGDHIRRYQHATCIICGKVKEIQIAKIKAPCISSNIVPFVPDPAPKHNLMKLAADATIDELNKVYNDTLTKKHK